MAKDKKVKLGRQSRPEDRRLQEDQWRKLLSEQLGSGLTQREFCRRHSIPEHRFSWWKREIATRDGKRSKSQGPKRARRREKGRQTSLVAVRLNASQLSSGNSNCHSPFELVLDNKWALRIPRDFDGEALLRLLRLLEEAC